MSPPGIVLPGGAILFSGDYDAEVAALASCVLLMVQIELMLPPAPMKRAADASATKAM